MGFSGMCYDLQVICFVLLKKKQVFYLQIVKNEGREREN